VVLGLHRMGLPPHCNLLRASLVDNSSHIWNIHSLRQSNLRETTSASKPRRY
jgi:hypothetical protein